MQCIRTAAGTHPEPPGWTSSSSATAPSPSPKSGGGSRNVGLLLACGAPALAAGPGCASVSLLSEYWPSKSIVSNNLFGMNLMHGARSGACSSNMSHCCLSRSSPRAVLRVPPGPPGRVQAAAAAPGGARAAVHACTRTTSSARSACAHAHTRIRKTQQGISRSHRTTHLHTHLTPRLKLQNPTGDGIAARLKEDMKTAMRAKDKVRLRGAEGCGWQ